RAGLGARAPARAHEPLLPGPHARRLHERAGGDAEGVAPRAGGGGALARGRRGGAPRAVWRRGPRGAAREGPRPRGLGPSDSWLSARGGLPRALAAPPGAGGARGAPPGGAAPTRARAARRRGAAPVKIYTRRGDGGETDLLGGGRVGKDDRRVEAYGAVDELNASLGACAAATAQSDIAELVRAIQAPLFALRAHPA